MKRFESEVKPDKCPRCGAPVYEILYGLPVMSEEEYFETYHEHVIYGGCCISEDDPEWRWCLVGNIVIEHPFGEEHEIRQGTKHFAPGAKVYCAQSMWGDGYESIGVLGTPRHGKRFIEIIMESKRIENFRIQKVFTPQILGIMKHSRFSWWGNGDKDRSEIMRYLKWLNPEEYSDR